MEVSTEEVTREIIVIKLEINDAVKLRTELALIGTAEDDQLYKLYSVLDDYLRNKGAIF